jgi:hypothetical protein
VPAVSPYYDVAALLSYTSIMALNIRNAEAEKLAAELAKATGESKTEAVTKALRDWPRS